jgi:hypothetical protein
MHLYHLRVQQGLQRQRLQAQGHLSTGLERYMCMHEEHCLHATLCLSLCTLQSIDSSRGLQCTGCIQQGLQGTGLTATVHVQ